MTSSIAGSVACRRHDAAAFRQRRRQRGFRMQQSYTDSLEHATERNKYIGTDERMPLWE